MTFDSLVDKISSQLKSLPDSGPEARHAYYARIREALKRSAGLDVDRARETALSVEQAIAKAELDFVALPDAAPARPTVSTSDGFWKRIFTICTGFAALADFLKPFINLQAVGITIAVIVVAVTLAGSRARPALASGLARLRTLVLALIVTLAGLFGVQSLFADDAPDGVLAQVFPPLTELQTQLAKSLGLLEEIKANTTEIAETMHGMKNDTSAVRESTATIATGVSEIQMGVAETKKETSDDPRKELANRGIAWTPEAFSLALNQSDIETLGLFLRGGWHFGDSAITYVENSGDPDLIALLKKYRTSTAREACDPEKTTLPEETDKLQVLFAICDPGRFRAYYEAELATSQHILDRYPVEVALRAAFLAACSSTLYQRYTPRLTDFPRKLMSYTGRTDADLSAYVDLYYPIKSRWERMSDDIKTDAEKMGEAQFVADAIVNDWKSSRNDYSMFGRYGYDNNTSSLNWFENNLAVDMLREVTETECDHAYPVIAGPPSTYLRDAYAADLERVPPA